MYQIFDREVGRSYNAFGTTIYTQRENVFTGNYWTYAFTDLSGNITSYRAATGFGDLDKEFNCRALGQTDDKELTSILTRESLWMSIVNSADNNKMVWASNKAHSTQKAAEKDALEQCKDEGNKNCKVMASYSNICLSSGIGARMVLILIFLALVGIKNKQIKMSLSNVSLKEEKIAKLSLRDSVQQLVTWSMRRDVSYLNQNGLNHNIKTNRLSLR